MAVREARFLRPSHEQLAKAQSAVLCSIFLRPSKNMDTPTQPLTRIGNLHLSFFSKNLGPSITRTQQKNSKQQSQSLSYQKSSSKTSPSLNEQLPDLLPLPSSLQYDHVSISRHTSPNSREKKLSDSAASVSSGELNSLITTIPN
jgi:hypothetical protein